NFIFMEDGRLGVIDFGCMFELDDAMWDYFRRMDRPLTTGEREPRIAVLKEWSWVGDDPADEERLRVMDEYTQWSWRSRFGGGAVRRVRQGGAGEEFLIAARPGVRADFWGFGENTGVMNGTPGPGTGRLPWWRCAPRCERYASSAARSGLKSLEPESSCLLSA